MSVPLDYATYSRILDRADIRRRVRKMASREAALTSLYHEEPTDAHRQALACYAKRDQVQAWLMKQAPPSASIPPTGALAAWQAEKRQVEAEGFPEEAGNAEIERRHPGLGMAARNEVARTTGPGPKSHGGAMVGNHHARLRKAVQLSAEGDTMTPTAILMAKAEAMVSEGSALTVAKALDVLAAAEPALWNAHILAQRQGAATPAPVAKAEPPSYEQIVAIAKAQAVSRPDLSTEEALTTMALEHPQEGAYWDAHRRWHLTDGLREHEAAVLAKRQGS